MDRAYVRESPPPKIVGFSLESPGSPKNVKIPGSGWASGNRWDKPSYTLENDQKREGLDQVIFLCKWMTFKASMLIFRGASHFFFGRKFQNVYKVGRRLGDGSFGSVSVSQGGPLSGVWVFLKFRCSICSWKRGGLGWKMCWFLLGPPFPDDFLRGLYSEGNLPPFQGDIPEIVQQKD